MTVLQELNKAMVGLHLKQQNQSEMPLGAALDDDWSLIVKRCGLMSLLSSLCEKHSSACLRQPAHVVEFVKVIY